MRDWLGTLFYRAAYKLLGRPERILIEVVSPTKVSLEGYRVPETMTAEDVSYLVDRLTRVAALTVREHTEGHEILRRAKQRLREDRPYADSLAHFGPGEDAS